MKGPSEQSLCVFTETENHSQNLLEMRTNNLGLWPSTAMNMQLLDSVPVSGFSLKLFLCNPANNPAVRRRIPED